MSRPIVLAITGASGAVYAVRLLQQLLLAGKHLHLTISPSGATVIKQELGVDIDLERFDAGSLLEYYWPSEELRWRRSNFAIGNVALPLQPAKQRRHRPRVFVDARAQAGRQHARNIFHQPAAGDVGEPLQRHALCQRQHGLYVYARGCEDQIFQRCTAELAR